MVPEEVRKEMRSCWVGGRRVSWWLSGRRGGEGRGGRGDGLFARRTGRSRA